MLTVLDAIKRVEQFEKELISSMPAISTDVAGAFVVAKIEQIRKVGIGNYSPKLYGAHRLIGKELNSAGKTFIEQKMKKNERTNWAQLRAAQGLQVGFVDVHYSGQMLNSTGIYEQKKVSNIFYSVIGARNDEAKKKMYRNMVRYGRFLTPDPSQEKVIGQRCLVLIGNIYKRILIN